MTIDVVAADIEHMLRMSQPAAFAVITVRFAFLALLRTLVREMEIGGQVQPMIIRQDIPVALAEVLYIPLHRIVVIGLRHQRAAVARRIHPRTRNINPRRDLVLQRDTQVVLTVVLGVERLAEIFMELQEKNVHNINLVTPTPYIPGELSKITIPRYAVSGISTGCSK